MSLVEYTANANTISHALFVNMTLGDTTYYFSDAYDALTVDGNVYTELGSLMSVGAFQDDYKSTEGTVDIAISGIPNNVNFINIINNQNIKGGEVNIYRVFFDADTLTQESNAYLRFRGIISNFNIEEETNIMQGQSTNTLVLSCSSVYTILTRKISGERTNTGARNALYPSDTSFNRIQYLSGLPRFG